MFPGNYDDFTIANLGVRELMEKQNKKMEKRIHELKAFISRFSANASKAKQATSRQKELGKIELNEMKASSRVSPYIRFEPKTRLGEKVIEVASGDFTEDYTISAIDESRTWADHYNSCNGTGAAFPRTKWIDFFLNSTTLRAQRWYNGQAANMAFQVIDASSWTYSAAATTDIKSINGLAKASIKSINGLAIGSIKNINGLE
jgi:hypothetical protein